MRHKFKDTTTCGTKQCVYSCYYEVVTENESGFVGLCSSFLKHTLFLHVAVCAQIVFSSLVFKFNITFRLADVTDLSN